MKLTRAIALAGLISLSACSLNWQRAAASDEILEPSPNGNNLGLRTITKYAVQQSLPLPNHTSIPGSTPGSLTLMPSPGSTLGPDPAQEYSPYNLGQLQVQPASSLPTAPLRAVDNGWTVKLYDPQLRLDGQNTDAAQLARLNTYLGQQRFGQEQGLAIDYQHNFVAVSALGSLDVGITPRASLAIGPEGSATRLGALVSIGQNLHEPRNSQSNWYIFAGGGAEALTYEPGGNGSFGDGLRLEEKVLVGDAQAGIAVRVGRANLSLAYVRRETDAYSRVSQLNSEDVENYAALTFTLGR
ncbi:MAG: hypothetical protein COA47_09415 [Robiginitomaculum sp.]|nr:MAG: hypothetical protein COA47_09415 [Robiginitomaculum sp.]